MRKKLTESRTVEEALEIGKQRIKDAEDIFDKYSDKMGEYFYERPCPFCGGENGEALEKFRGRYDVARCRRCGSKYVKSCPSQELLDDYYNNYECNFMLEKIYKKRASKEHNHILDSRIETIAKYIEEKSGDKIRILDVGCSNGSFLARLKKRILDSGISKSVEFCGVDVNDNAVKNSVDKSLHLITGSAEEYLSEISDYYDLIWHSELVEHLADPFETFKAMRHALKAGGYMIFTTPNDYSMEMDNFSYNIPRPLAPNILPPMHLNSFSTINVPILALRTGFEVVSVTTPGSFDVELIEMNMKDGRYQFLEKITSMTEEEKDFIQNLIVCCHGSSHLQCVLRKPVEE